MNKQKIRNILKECESLKCELKEFNKKLPPLPPQPSKTVILCPFIAEYQKNTNPLKASDDTHYILQHLDGVLNACPAVSCVARRGIYCLSQKQLEQIKKMEEKTK